MKGVICRLFNLYEGEGKNAFLFGILAFCWSLGINLGLKFSDALLLINVGAHALPLVYILCACGMLIPAVLLLRVVNRIPSQKIFYSVIAVVIVFYTGILFCIKQEIGFESRKIWYILRIVSFQLDSVLITTYWTFIDQYHNLQDAKRMYVLFSLTVFCGQAFTGIIMQTGFFTFSHIILMIIVLMMVSAYLVKVISDRMHLAHDLSSEKEEQSSSGKFNFINTAKEILKSKFTLLVMLNNFLIFLMWVNAEYNYLDFFDRYFDPPGTLVPSDEAKNAAITLFLGKMIATVSVTNLIFGLLLYSRVIRRFGVTSLLFFTPIIMVFAMSGWLFYPALLFPIVAYFLVEGFLEIIDESNFNLLLNAVPKRLKYRVRIMIEFFFEPLAMLCSGFLLFTPGINTITLCLIISICALAVAFIIQKKYHAAIYKNLAANAIHPERSLKEWYDSLAKDEQHLWKVHLFTILNSSEKLSERIFALQGLLGLEDPKILLSIMSDTKSLSPDFQKQLLLLLSKSKLGSEPEINALLKSRLPETDDEELAADITYQLARQGMVDQATAISNLTGNNSIKKAAAVISLKKADSVPGFEYTHDDKKIADEIILSLLNSGEEERICMALEILSCEPTTNHHQLFLSFRDHPNQQVRRKALECFAKISNSQCRIYAKILISLMKNSHDSTFRKSCLYALGKINDPSLIRDILRASLHFRQSEKRIIESIVRKMGLHTVPMLLTATKDKTLPDPCRALAGRILGHLALTHLHANLHDIINVEVERAYFYYYHFQFVCAKNPDRDLTLLVEALETGYHSVLDFIVQILSAAGEVEDCELISRLFRSKDKKLKSQVIETLEKTCDRNIFKILRPLIENLPAKEIFNRHPDKNKYDCDLKTLLEKLSDSSSPVDKIVSLSLMKEFNFEGWRAIAEKLSLSHEQIFTHFARELFNEPA